ncbi:MAG: MBL fold metallo-hydrolase, partial [Candidatus Eisenbacteria bacterium]|nr:MBL fold metallo-hydrolase [Candidatus Eisenbacteria bacterium]
LGTGTPRPNPERAGPATAVTVGDRLFLFDAGPAVMRQLAAAKLSIKGAEAAFITHLHSDHTLGYPDLIFTSWVMGRQQSMPVYGPPGLKAMTDHILAAWGEDIEIRTHGLEREAPGGYQVQVHEIQLPTPPDSSSSPKSRTLVVYDSAGVKVTAIPVPHGNWRHAYGYRIDTPDRSIVLSGDTAYSTLILEMSRGVDVLIHEVYPEVRLKPEPRPGGELWPQYMKEFHTSDIEVGRLAAAARPKLLLLHHVVWMGGVEEELIQGVRQGGYDGEVTVGADLGRY